MNAVEARLISQQNVSKLAKEYFDLTVERINSEIRQSAEKGKCNAQVEVTLNNVWVKENLTDKVADHFVQKGFEVAVGQRLFSRVFRISW
jgi:hypothetical protein